MWNKFKNLSYNTKLNVFYGLSVIGILYFLYDINVVATALSNNQLYFTTPQDMVNMFQPQAITYDYNLTIGGAIWKIAVDILQIVFFVGFMLVLYIHEVKNSGSN